MFFLLFALGVIATPIVVDLQSNWQAPPFELSVVEAIAGENATAFYPMVSALVALNEAKGRQSDEGYRTELVNHAVEAEFLTNRQVEYVDLALAMHKQSAAIQAYYQYYETNIGKKNCENVFVYNNKVSCDKDSVFALESDAGRDVEVLPKDRVLGDNPEAPIAVLYADIASESFPVFHSHLVSSALDGKIQYILRVKPSKSVQTRENLAGYGLEMALKRTDYIVIDDRNKAKDEGDKNVADNVQISKDELENLGLRACTFIMKSKDQFAAMANVSLDFPSLVQTLADTDANPDLMEDLTHNSGVLKPGQSALLVNGAQAFQIDTSVFALMDVVDQERAFMLRMQEFGLDTKQSAQFIQQNLVGQLDEDSPRYDYRTSGLVWLNDLARDRKYREFPDDVELFLNEDFPGQFYPIRHNAVSVVVAVDLSAPEHLALLGQAYSIMQRGVPIQFGVIPLTNSYYGRQCAKELAWLDEYGSGGAVDKYIMQLLTGTESSRALKAVLGEKQDVEVPQVEAIMNHTDDWIKRFDVKNGMPMIFANGMPVTPSGQWMMEASSLMSGDLPEIRKIVENNQVSRSNPIREQLLEGALKTRNTLVTPTNPEDVKFVDTEKLKVDAIVAEFDHGSEDLYTVHLTGDFANPEPLAQLTELVKFANAATVNVQLSVLPITDPALKNTNLRQERRSLVTKAIQSLGTVDGKDMEHGLEGLAKFIKNKAPGDETINKACGWDATFAPVKDTRPFDSTFMLTDDTLLGTNLVLGGRIINLKDQTLDHAALDLLLSTETPRINAIAKGAKQLGVDVDDYATRDMIVSFYTKTYYMDGMNDFFISQAAPRASVDVFAGNHTMFEKGSGPMQVTAVINPLSERGQQLVTYLQLLSNLDDFTIKVFVNPAPMIEEMPLKRFYRGCMPHKPRFVDGLRVKDTVTYDQLDQDTLYNAEIHTPNAWLVDPERSEYDLENIVLNSVTGDKLDATYELRNIMLEGHAVDAQRRAPRGLALELGNAAVPLVTDTSVMANLGYFQFQANPGWWNMQLREGRSSEVYKLLTVGMKYEGEEVHNDKIWMDSMTGTTIFPKVARNKGHENSDVLESTKQSIFSWKKKQVVKKQADINIFTVASGHLYERFLSIMTASVMKHTDHTVKFWLIEQFLSPSFKEFLPHLAKEYGFEYELVTYKWPHWLRSQQEKQRTIWGYKILFLDVLFPQSLEKVIFVDADQIVRTDLKELVDLDLGGAPYGYTPMCDSREEMEGFRFWKQGYWKTLLGNTHKYHISALYVIDLNKFRQMAAGDRIRAHYQQLSADKNSLSNLDQDLPNNLQSEIPIFSLPQDWLWCETWCSDESLKSAKTIDLCNNPLTKEPKLARARRQIPEWVEYDDAIAKLQSRVENVEQDEEDEEAEDEEDVPEVEADHDEL